MGFSLSSSLRPKATNSLKNQEKRYFEDLFDMGSGYVLDYSDRTFGNLFSTYGINIHGKKYQTYGTSKAKKLRAFWDQEQDYLVGKILLSMLVSYEMRHYTKNENRNASLFKKAHKAAKRLLEDKSATNIKTSHMRGDGNFIIKSASPPAQNIIIHQSPPPTPPPQPVVNKFLDREVKIPNVKNLPIDPRLIPIIESRYIEASKALEAGCYLSAIILCGSMLEGVLLGAAQKDPARFNQAQASPKNSDGKVKSFNFWKLVELINVACEVGLVKHNVKEFSHSLRGYRNHIHIHAQIEDDFETDKDTAEICFQVLRMALAGVAKNGKN